MSDDTEYVVRDIAKPTTLRVMADVVAEMAMDKVREQIRAMIREELDRQPQSGDSK